MKKALTRSNLTLCALAGLTALITGCTAPAGNSASVPTSAPTQIVASPTVVAATATTAPTTAAMATAVPTAEIGGVAASGASASGASARPTSSVLNISPDFVVAGARVAPLESLDLTFEREGIVAEVLVKEGEQVKAGQTIARLDSRNLDIAVENAQAALAQAQAQLRQAESRVSAQDIAAARAALEQSRAALAQLLSGPKETEVRAARSLVERAEVNLQTTRDRLSVEKNDAKLDLEKAANNLRNRQDQYSEIYWKNRGLQQNGGELTPEQINEEAIALRDVQDAETEVEQTKLSFEKAQEAEVNGIKDAETRVTEAQAKLDLLLTPADPDRIAAARADVARAEATLERLTGSARAADLSTARAQVQQRSTDVKQARLALDKATLRAPIAGTIAVMGISIGEEVRSGQPALTLADFSGWRIQTEDLVELDVVRIREGAPAKITFDALPDLELPGKVVMVRPAGTNTANSNYTTYTVIIEPERWDDRLRWNMTASVEIDTKAQAQP